MTPTEDVGQAERRTASGGGLLASLNLIHRNNCSNPVSMRVPGRFAPRLIRPLRAALYLPVSGLEYLPGGPVRWLRLVRFVVGVVERVDRPMRAVLLGRGHG